jgi:hypothetical protein
MQTASSCPFVKMSIAARCEDGGKEQSQRTKLKGNPGLKGLGMQPGGGRMNGQEDE